MHEVKVIIEPKIIRVNGFSATRINLILSVVNVNLVRSFLHEKLSYRKFIRNGTQVYLWKIGITGFINSS